VIPFLKKARIRKSIAIKGICWLFRMGDERQGDERIIAKGYTS
jgi:hypothetical protein